MSGRRRARGLRPRGLDIVPVLVPPGEASKSWARLEALTERLLELGVERGDPILAFGGGMVGDLAGFAASILKRGCAYVQVPTSLLAQVDSSVGGKTAINAGGGQEFDRRLPPAGGGSDRPLDPRHPAGAGAARRLCRGREIRPDRRSRLLRLVRGERRRSARRRRRTPGSHAIETCVRAKAAIVAEDERETKGAPGPAQFRPHVRPCAGGGEPAFAHAPRRGGGARHGARLPLLGGARAVPGRGGGAGRRRISRRSGCRPRLEGVSARAARSAHGGRQEGERRAGGVRPDPRDRRGVRRPLGGAGRGARRSWSGSWTLIALSRQKARGSSVANKLQATGPRLPETGEVTRPARPVAAGCPG